MLTLPLYVRPQTTVQEEYAAIAQAVIQPQFAVIVGPNKQVLQYSNPVDRSSVSYGAYSSSLDTVYPYLARPAGGVVDQSTVALQLENVVAQIATFTAADTIERGALANQIQFNSGVSNGNFASSNNGTTSFLRHASFRNRDVRIGDLITITKPDNSVSLSTRVTGLVNGLVPAVIAAPALDASVPGAHEAATTVLAVDAKTTDHILNVNTDNTTYVGSLSKGWVSDLYTITVLQGGTCGVNGTAVLSISSINGDNIASLPLNGVAFASPFNVGTCGLQADFTSLGVESFVTGETYTIQAYAYYIQQAPTAPNSNYLGNVSTVYKVKVVKGGLWIDNPQVVVTTNNGVDQAGPRAIAYNTSFPIGTLGVNFKFPTNTGAAQNGLMLGEIYTVSVTAALPGGVTTINLANPIPTTIATTQGDDLNAVFSLSNPSIAIPSVGYPLSGDTALVAGDTSFTVKSGIQITDPSWTDYDGVSLVPISVASADVFVGYTALKTANTGVLQSLSDISSVPLILDKVINLNPLAYGVNAALLNSNGQPIYFLAVASDDVAGYTAALAALESTRQVYFKVPLSQDPAVLSLMQGHVNALSGGSHQNWCYGIFASQFNQNITLYGGKSNGSNWTGYVSQTPGSNPATYGYVTVPGATFLTDGVRPGDIFRTSFDLDKFGNTVYNQAIVDHVVDQEDLVLYGSGFSAAVGDSSHLQQVQIVRTLSNDEFALAGNAISAAFGSQRISNVYCNFPLADNPAFVACAIAGLGSSVAPHQPITNYTLNGFENQTGGGPKLTPTQCDVLANGGTLIVTQDAAGGPVYIRHQLTTAYTDPLHWEMSATKNFDSIALYFYNLINPMVGKYNANPNLLQLVDVQMRAGLDYLAGTATSTPTAGSQITSWDSTSLSVARNATVATEIDINVAIQLPVPANNFNIGLTAGVNSFTATNTVGTT